MSSIDNRVVEMDFDNQKFEKGVRKTLDSITELKQNLDFKETEKGFNKFENQANASFDKIGSGLDRLNKKFSTFGVAWMSVVNRVTTRAVDSFINTINQIRTGGENRARNIEQASFMLEGMFGKMKNGAKMIEEIKKNAMDAVDSTAYGFDESAKAAAQFAASGVKAGKQMENTLKGVAGVAAMTSSSFSEVADIFTTAAGKGKVQADEFNRLAYKGLNARAELAKQLKITEAEVNELAKDGEISFQMFADAMAKAYGEQAKKANETFDGALSNVKASLNRIGELWYTPHRENMRRVFVEEIDMFNKLKVVLKPIIGVFRRLDRLYSNFKIRKIHEITDALTAMGKISDRLFRKNVQKGLSRGIRYLLHPIKQVVVAATRGFEKVFQLREKLKDSFNMNALAKSTKGNHNRVLNVTRTIIKAVKAFREWAHTVRLSKQGMDNLTDTFGGFFAIGHIVIKLINSIIKAINPTGKTFGNLIELILALTGAIGRAIMAFDKFLDETGAVDKIGSIIGGVIGGIIKAFSSIISGIGKGISGFEGIFSSALSTVTAFVKKVAGLFKGIGNPVKSFAKTVKSFVSGTFDKLLDALGLIDNGIVKIKEDGQVGKMISKIKEFGNTIKDTFAVKVLDNAASLAKHLKEIFGIVNKDGSITKGSIFDWFAKLTEPIRTYDFSKFSLEDVGNQFKKIKTPIEEATTKMWGFIESLDPKGGIKKKTSNLVKALDNVRQQGFGNFIKSLDIKGKAASLGTGVLGLFSSIWSTIKNADYVAIGDTIAKGFGEFIEVLGNIKDGIVAFYKNHLAEKIETLGDALASFFKKLPERAMKGSAKAFEIFAGGLIALANGVKSSFGGLQNFFSNFGKGNGNLVSIIEQVVFGVIGALLLFKQFKAIKDIKSSVAPVISFMGTLEGTIKSLGTALKDGFKFGKIETKYDQIVKVAKALVLLAAALKIVSMVDPDRIVGSLIALGAMLGGIIVAIKIASILFSKIESDKITAMAAGMLLVSAAVGVLALAFVALAKTIDDKNFGMAWYALLTCAAVLIGLAGAMTFLMTKVKGFDTKAFFGLGIALLAMAKGVDIVARSLVMIAECEDDLWPAIAAMGVILAGMAAFTGLTGLGKHILKASISMLILGTAIAKMVAIMYVVGKYLDEDIFKRGFDMIRPILDFFLAFGVIGIFAKNAGKTSLLLLTAVAAVAAVIQEIVWVADLMENTEGFNDALKIVAGIGIFLLALAAIGGLLGNGNLKNSAGIGILAAGILAIAAAMSVLMEVMARGGNLVQGILGVAAAIGLLCLAMIAFKRLGDMKVSATAVLIAAGLLLLAAAIAIIASLPLAALAVAILALAVSIGVFLGIMSLFAMVGTPLLVVAGALALFGVAVALVGVGLKFLVAGLANLIPLLLILYGLPNDVLAAGLAAIETILTTIGSALWELGKGLLFAAAAFIGAAVGVGLFGIAIAIVAAGILALSVAIVSLVGAIYLASQVIGVSISEIASQVMGVLGGMFGWIVNGLSSIGEKWKSFKNSITGGLKETEKTIDESNKSATERIGKNNKESAKKNMQEYAKGTESEKDNVFKAQASALDPKDVMIQIKDKYLKGGEEVIGKEGFMGGITNGLSENSLDISQFSDMLNFDGLGEQFNVEGIDIGSMLPEGMQQGIDGQSLDVSGIMSDLGVDLSDTKETEKAAKKQSKTYGTTMSKEGTPKKEAKKMNKEAAKASDDKSGFITSGHNAALGYAEGIRAYARKAADEAAAMVRKAKRAAKNAQGEKSPARLFIESGMFAALGYAVGIERYSKESEYAAEDMVANTYATMREAIARAQRFADDEINVDPTIRPVVDLSNVEQSASQISSMFGTGPFGLAIPSTGIRLAENISADIQNGGKSEMARSIDRLSKRLETVTETMNSRQMINNFNVDGASNPEAFADSVVDRFKLNARAV